MLSIARMSSEFFAFKTSAAPASASFRLTRNLLGNTQEEHSGWAVGEELVKTMARETKFTDRTWS
jgi:hypothetical protein